MQVTLTDNVSGLEIVYHRFHKSRRFATGYRAVITGDAAVFKQAYHDLDPTIILLDMVMPETDGFELMQWLMEQGYTAKVVLITGFNARYAEMALTLGIDRGLSDVTSLPKPVPLTEFRAALGIA